MEIKRKASSSSFQKFIELNAKPGTVYLETNIYTKKWGARFKLCSGFTAENIDDVAELIAETKRILESPDTEWEAIVNGEW
jgi:hypothetical protein